MARLVISLFGAFQVQLDGQPVTHFGSDKVRALLAYLAVEAGRLHRREHLAGLLWPDYLESAARHSLSQSLLRLRQAIGDYGADPPFLLITPQTIQFNPAGDYWLDVAAFGAPPPTDTAAGATTAALAQTVALYTGDFLAGFYGADSSLFEEWALAKREVFRTRVLVALEQLAARYEEQGAFAAAQPYIRRQLELDPLREESHRHLMRLLALSGRRSEALAQYLACRRILAEELGVEPAPETAALYATIRADRIPPQTETRRTDIRQSAVEPAVEAGPQMYQGEMPDAALFYGREAEQRELTDWLTRDRCRLVAVVGMGGVGKTSLAAYVVRAVAHHFDVVIWRSLLNAPPPAEIVHEWLDRLAEAPLRGQLGSFDSQVRLLLNLLRRRRCLLILDNAESVMQPGERAGRYQPGYTLYGQLWQRLGEGAHQSSLLLTSRDKPLEFSRLERGQGVVRTQRLSGLSPAAGQKLLRAEGLAGTDADVEDLRQCYGGNPLALRLVAELIQELHGGEIAPFLRQDRLMFDDMEDVLHQQFARLSALETEVMTWLAIEREAISPQALHPQLVQPCSAGELAAAFRSLGRRSLVQPRGAEFTLQNVIIEYTTLRLVDQVYQALAAPPGRIEHSSFNRYPLLKAQAKAYIRQSQQRLILQPLAARLAGQWGQDELAERLKRLLNTLHRAAPRTPGYAGGNLLNLLLQLGIDCRDYDFSGLCVWQADLLGKTMQAVNFTDADLRDAAFTGTLGALTAVAFSPDGRLLAAATDDCLIWLWRAATGEPLAVLAGHEDFITAIAFSPDGALLASGSGDRTARLWDVRELAAGSGPVRTFRGDSYDVIGVAFDPTGALLATVSVDCVRIRQVQTGAELFCSGELAGRSDTVAWSPDGRRLAINTGSTIEVWDAQATLAAQSASVQQRLHGHGERVRGLAFSPDGELLVSASDDHSVRVWRLAGGRSVQALHGHAGSVYTVAVSPEGGLIASGGADRKIHLWSAQTGARLGSLHGHAGTVKSVAFAPDGQTLVSGGAAHTVRLWDAQSGRLLRTIQGHTRLIHGVAFSPAGDWYACAVQDGTARLWHAEDHREGPVLRGDQGVVWRVVFSPDGKLLASGGHDGSVCIWSVPAGKLLMRLPPHSKQLSSLAFSPDGQILASSGYGGTLRLWDLRADRLLDALAHPARLASLAFHPGGDLLAASCYDTLIYLWDMRRRQIVRTLQGHRYEAWGLCFSPDGSVLASSSDDQTVRLWEPHTGVCRGVLEGHTGTVQSLAFHPSGAILASGSQDRTIHLWDVANDVAAAPAAGRPARILEGHRHRVTGLAFSPDGSRLLSGSADETMRLWDIQRGVCMEVKHIPGPYEGMQIGGVSGLTAAQVANLKALGAQDSPHASPTN